MENPSQDDVTQMIEHIFARVDKMLADNELDPPGDQTGFTELLRLLFSADDSGMAIFAAMDDELLVLLFKLYDERRIRQQVAPNYE
ncbi:MAG: hypothetical protein ACON44_01145 [Candidatus Puniceispirillaceae bacterium]